MKITKKILEKRFNCKINSIFSPSLKKMIWEVNIKNKESIEVEYKETLNDVYLLLNRFYEYGEEYM